MKKTFQIPALLIAATFSTFAAAKDTTPVTQAFPTGEYDQITDSVTQFLRIDGNKDGKISLAEAQAAGINEGAFKRMDSNGDNVVELKEYQVSILTKQ